MMRWDVSFNEIAVMRDGFVPAWEVVYVNQNYRNPVTRAEGLSTYTLEHFQLKFRANSGIYEKDFVRNGCFDFRFFSLI